MFAAQRDWDPSPRGPSPTPVTSVSFLRAGTLCCASLLRRTRRRAGTSLMLRRCSFPSFDETMTSLSYSWPFHPLCFPEVSVPSALWFGEMMLHEFRFRQPWKWWHKAELAVWVCPGQIPSGCLGSAVVEMCHLLCVQVTQVMDCPGETRLQQGRHFHPNSHWIAEWPICSHIYSFSRWHGAL